jgi:hypothetical protein
MNILRMNLEVRIRHFERDRMLFIRGNFKRKEFFSKGVVEFLWLQYHESVGWGNFLGCSLDELSNYVQ